MALGRSLKEVPEVPKDMTDQALVTARFLYRQTLVNQFWKRWRAEYLPKLTVRQKWRTTKPPLKVGDVVLISEENVKRGNWSLGIVHEVHKGSDKHIRTVTLKTKSGIRRRSVQKLYLLEEAAHLRQGTSQVDEERKTEPASSPVSEAKERNEIPKFTSDDGVWKDSDTSCQGRENVRTRSGRLIRPPKAFTIE